MKFLNQFLWIYHYNMMDKKFNIFVICLVTGCLLSGSHSLVELTNARCETLDRKFLDFEYCFLKSVNRSYKYVSVKVRLFQVPITDCKVNLAMYQRLNGLKPFLYNLTVDGCKFLKNPRSNPIANYFFGFIKSFSNINHSCPYDHDVVVDKVSSEFMNNRLTKMLPFPEGRYMFQSDWYVYGIKRVEARIYYTIS